MLHFILHDPKKRTFRTERMCYLGNIDNWIDIGRTGPIEQLARDILPFLGTNEFFDLFWER